MQAFRRHGCVAVCTFEPAEIDLLDSKMYEMFDALSGVSVGAFSERQWALDNRQLYRHTHGQAKPRA